MPKADNMLAVLWLLQSRSRLTAAEIAEELEISVRTVYRYIDALCMSGVPIIAEAGHEGGYSLSATFRRTPLFFEADESKALFHAAQFARRAGYPFGETLDKALAKLEQNAPPSQNEYVERHTDGFGVVSPPRGGEVGPWLGLLADAVANCQTLHVLYHKANASVAQWRTVDPYGLAFDSGLWYLAVFCHERQAMRDFRVDRIIDVQVTDQNFHRPSDFSVEQYFSIQEMVREIQQGPLSMVVIHGSGPAIQSICDHWFMRYCTKERGHGQVTLHVNAQTEERIAGFLLSYGTEIEIIEPATMREELARLARAWAEHHHRVPPKVP